MKNFNNEDAAHSLAAGQCADGEECAAHRAGLPKRSSFDLDVQEEVTLEVVRLLLSTYLTGDARFWDGAVDFADINLGDVHGMTIVMHGTRFVKALQRDRKTPFNFLTFGCQHISEDELAMISALQAARLGWDGDTEDALAHLAQGTPYVHLRKSVLDLSAAMEDVKFAASQTACEGGRASPAVLH